MECSKLAKWTADPAAETTHRHVQPTGQQLVWAKTAHKARRANSYHVPLWVYVQDKMDSSKLLICSIKSRVVIGLISQNTTLFISPSVCDSLAIWSSQKHIDVCQRNMKKGNQSPYKAKCRKPQHSIWFELGSIYLLYEVRVWEATAERRGRLYCRDRFFFTEGHKMWMLWHH